MIFALPDTTAPWVLAAPHVQELYLFTDKEDVSGVVKIKPNGKPVAHEGIKIECIGQIGKQSPRCPPATCSS